MVFIFKSIFRRGVGEEERGWDVVHRIISTRKNVNWLVISVAEHLFSGEDVLEAKKVTLEKANNQSQ